MSIESQFQQGQVEPQPPALPVGNRVARNLSILRERAGLTQQQLADAAGISRATVHLIESGRGDPRLSTLELLARALAVDTRDLTDARA